MIFNFRCACGVSFHESMRGADAGLLKCPGCYAPITPAMIAAAEPIGVESDGPDPRAPELSLFGLHIADSREVDALRDLRALVLRLDATFAAGGPLTHQWISVVEAARAACTPATFVPMEPGECDRERVQSAPATLRRCEHHGCPFEAEPNLKKCRAHEGGFTISIVSTGRTSIATVFPTEEHACPHCYLVTHARVGMGPPSPCPGCGK